MTCDDAVAGIQLGRMLAGQLHASVVYFLATTYRHREAVKIGTSTRLKTRITGVSYSATLTDVLLLLPGGRDVETACHDRFRKYQVPSFRELFWRQGHLRDFLAQEPSPIQRRPLSPCGPERESLPEPEPPSLDAPMSLLAIVRAGLVPDVTKRALEMDRHRSDRGLLPDGLLFPEPVGIAEGGRQTELFVPFAVVEFNEARRGRKVA